MNASTRLSMTGKSPMILEAPPFVLRLSKDERMVFQQNRHLNNLSPWLGKKTRVIYGVDPSTSSGFRPTAVLEGVTDLPVGLHVE